MSEKIRENKIVSTFALYFTIADQMLNNLGPCSTHTPFYTINCDILMTVNLFYSSNQLKHSFICFQGQSFNKFPSCMFQGTRKTINTCK